MKLAFVLFNYFPFGGLQRDFIRILQTCLQRGHEIYIFTQSWQDEIPKGINVKLIKTSRWTNHGRANQFVELIQSDLQNGSFDKIIGFNKMPGLDWYYCADTCFVANAAEKHKKWYRFSSRYKTYAELERSVFEPSMDTRILLLSATEQIRYTTHYNTASSRFHLLPPGIDKTRKRPDNVEQIKQLIRDKLNLNNDQYLLAFVGSGFKTKGLDRVLISLGALPSHLKNITKLIIIGQDNPKPFQTLIKKYRLQNQVEFLGGVHDVENYLWAADLLVHPAYRENTGTVLLEAMVAGLPVLTTANCGYANYISKAEAGLVFSNPFNQNDFNKALASTLESEQQRKVWQNNALTFAKNADIYHLPERAVDLIETVGTL